MPLSRQDNAHIAGEDGEPSTRILVLTTPAEDKSKKVHSVFMRRRRLVEGYSAALDLLGAEGHVIEA